MTHVWLVINDDCVDDVYVFACEDDAEAFADTYGGEAFTSEMRIIDRAMAAEMIAERGHAVDEHDEQCDTAGSGDHIVCAGCSL